MILNVTQADGAELTEVRVKRTGYEIDWEITIGGVKHTLTKAETVLPYQEDQKIEVPKNADSTSVTVSGKQILLELEGGAATGGGGNVSGKD